MTDQDSWYHERESAWLYRLLASTEAGPTQRELFDALAHAAEQQALIWQARLGREPPFRLRLRARIVGTLIRRCGGRQLRPMLAAMKLRGLSSYDLAGATGHSMPVSVHEVGQRHRLAGSGTLRAAVFGVNDGLVSNTSLILGVAGAGAAPQFILMSGLAGLLAGALSMAAGEYVSVRSQREMYEYQIGLERAELAAYPAEEAEELALIYAARGIALEQARTMARQLVANPEHALDTLAREELGLDPDNLGSPWGAASASLASFASGALLPLAAFWLSASAPYRLAVVGGCALAGLFAVGMILSLYSGRNALWGGVRMALIGSLAAGCSWLAGRAFGTAAG
ncbi:MAG TPA: VIT1/CCC1 transporter family protein [Steroidobacteraceae bacterium]|nr:VIT1/CCC1 transporter family protein [Steroidobacteraceae bacterium]